MPTNAIFCPPNPISYSSAENSSVDTIDWLQKQASVERCRELRKREIMRGPDREEKVNTYRVKEGEVVKERE